MTRYNDAAVERRSRNHNFKGRLHPVTGWPLDTAVQIDLFHNGFLSGLCRSKAVHRQAVFLAFAMKVHSSPDAFVEKAIGAAPEDWGEVTRALGQNLLELSAPAIVESLFGAVPEGFVGALERIGYEPLREPEAYQRLHRIFSSPRERRRRAALTARALIDDHRIDVAAQLHESMLHPLVAAKVRDADHAAQINAAIGVVQDFVSTASTGALSSSAAALKPETRLNDFLSRWLARADLFPAPPFDMDPAVVVPLTSAREMARAGRELSNCLGTKVLSVVCGRNYFYRLVIEPGGIVALTRLSDGSWLLGYLHGPSNDNLPTGYYERVRQEFERCGARCLVPAPVEHRFSVAEQVMSRFGWNDLAVDHLEDVGQFR